MSMSKVQKSIMLNTVLLANSNTAKWIASVLFLLAAILLSSNNEVSKYGMILFLIGHIMLTFVFYKHKDNPMIFQNGVFIIVDVYGVYNWWF